MLSRHDPAFLCRSADVRGQFLPHHAGGGHPLTPTSVPPSCRICRSAHTRLWKARSLQRALRPHDLQITDTRYGTTLTLYRCRDCSFIFSDDREVADLAGMHECLIDPVYESTNESRSRQMRWLLSFGRRAHPHARTLLDIGAASGLLVSHALREGLEAVGVEPSAALVEAARRINQVGILQGTFPHPALAGRRFDLVYVIDVLEHVADPVDLLQSVKQALAPGGLALVSTPDIGSTAARLLGRRWWHLRVSHVGYFNRRSFQRAAQAAGLSVERSATARWFFPVSYLAKRLAVYVPFLTAIHSAVSFLPGFNHLSQVIVPVNLRDSRLFVLRRL